MSGVQLEISDCEKDLGVYVDSHLTFDDQVESAVQKGMRMIGWIARVFCSRKPQTLIPVYQSIIRPCLEYGTAVWNPTQKGHIARIERVQKRFTKMLLGVRHLTYAQRLSVLGLERLSARRLYFDLYMTRNILIDSGNENEVLFRFFRKDESARRGHKYKLYIERFETEVRRTSFAHRVVSSWNNLPEAVVDTIEHKDIFATLLRDHVNRIDGVSSCD
jgi:hypothetical protein